MSQPRVTNVCVSFNCSCVLDLFNIYYHNNLKLPIRYDPFRFPGLRVRLLNSMTTALIFSSGHVGLLGTKSLENAISGSEEVIDMLIKHDYDAKKINFKVNNI